MSLLDQLPRWKLTQLAGMKVLRFPKEQFLARKVQTKTLEDTKALIFHLTGVLPSELDGEWEWKETETDLYLIVKEKKNES